MPYRYPVKFGKYLLTRRVAVGGMAELFKAKLIGIKGFEKTLAVKRILPEFSEDDEFIQMFVDEARISSHLHHPNIVQVFDFGAVDRAYYIAMEFIDGPNLKHLLQRVLKAKGRFPRNVAIYVISEISKALDYAHHVRIEGAAVLNLVHRDVSPQNILASRTGLIKITDFGIAKAEIKLSQTQPGKIQGKFSYMSPEQSAGKDIDHRSDIFSLGIIAYEILSGIKLYGAEDTRQRYKEVREANIPRLGALVPDLPAQLESLVMRMLAKDPNDRPQTCAEVTKELSEVLSNIPTERLTEELGQLVEESFPAEQSDSSVGRRVDAFVQGGKSDSEPATEVAGPIPTLKGEESTKSISSEVTIPGGFRDWITRPATWWVAASLLATLAAAAFYESRKPSVEPPQPTLVTATPLVTEKVDPDPETTASPSLAQLEAEARDIARRQEEDRLQRQKEELNEAAIRDFEQKKTIREMASVETGTGAPSTPCPKGMILIDKGTFLYGSDDPGRNVFVEFEATSIPNPKFCIDAFEYPNRRGATPKTAVTWSQALSLCTAQGKRLCGQEEWERACKGPTSKGHNRHYPYGDRWDPSRCNTELDSKSGGDDERKLATSGGFAGCVSPEGVYDMSGNADEWTSSPGRFSQGSRVTRGGSNKRPGWATRCTSLRELRDSAKEDELADVGLRCCKDAQ